VLGQHRGFGRRKNAIESAEDGARENDLPVFIPLVRPAQQIANAPDEAGDLGVRLGGFGAAVPAGKEKEWDEAERSEPGVKSPAREFVVCRRKARAASPPAAGAWAFRDWRTRSAAESSAVENRRSLGLGARGSEPVPP
jgi:hypothetical protein